MSTAKLATEFDRAEDSPGFLLWQLSNQWQAQQRVALKPFGLTHVQFVLLATLTYTAGQASLTQKQLAHFARTDEMMTSQVLRKLEQKGLVRRETSKVDKRAFVIKPTAAGSKLVNRAVRAVEKVDAQFFSHLGADLLQFTKMMQRLVS